MEENNQVPIVNAIEAKNGTATAIHNKHRELIQEFNKHIIDQCANRKTFVYYTTTDESLAKDLNYFYTILGYHIETQESDVATVTQYKLKICW